MLDCVVRVEVIIIEIYYLLMEPDICSELCKFFIHDDRVELSKFSHNRLFVAWFKLLAELRIMKFTYRGNFASV